MKMSVFCYLVTLHVWNGKKIYTAWLSNKCQSWNICLLSKNIISPILCSKSTEQNYRKLPKHWTAHVPWVGPQQQLWTSPCMRNKRLFSSTALVCNQAFLLWSQIQLHLSPNDILPEIAALMKQKKGREKFSKVLSPPQCSALSPSPLPYKQKPFSIHQRL